MVGGIACSTFDRQGAVFFVMGAIMRFSAVGTYCRVRTWGTMPIFLTTVAPQRGRVVRSEGKALMEKEDMVRRVPGSKNEEKGSSGASGSVPREFLNVDHIKRAQLLE